MTTGPEAQRSTEDIGHVADPAWLERVRDELGANPVLDDEGALVIRVQTGADVNLEGAPQGRTIRLPGLGAHQPSVRLVVGRAILQRVIVEAHEQLRELGIDTAGRIDDLMVHSAGGDRVLDLVGRGDLRVLRLQGGAFTISSIEVLRPTTVLDLRDATLDASDIPQPAQLVLAGQVRIRTGLRVQSSLVTSGTTIEGPDGEDLSLGVVNPEQQASDPPLEVVLDTRSRCRVGYLPPSTTVRLRGGSLVLRRPGPAPAEPPHDSTVARFLQAPPALIERLVVIGSGVVQTGWDLESPVFTPEGGELTLHIEDPGNVMNASGRVAIGTLKAGVLCQGSPTSPLVVTRLLGEIEDAELERIDIYDLAVGDVRRLKATARITPWIPVRPWAARKRELAMALGTSDTRLRAQRRADFWTQFADVLSAQQASGSVQSNVRVAAMRARRKALGYGRERFWLAAYSLIGYGERILIPITFWLAGVVVAGVLYTFVVGAPYTIVSFEFVKLLMRLMAGPLAILRVEELRPGNVPGSWDTVIWVGAQVLGTICLGAMLVAIRKVTRPSQ